MPACEHKKTEFLMRRDGVEYIRCLGCDQVFEADDLEKIAVYEDEEDKDARPAYRHPHRDRKAS